MFLYHPLQTWRVTFGKQWRMFLPLLPGYRARRAKHKSPLQEHSLVPHNARAYEQCICVNFTIDLPWGKKSGDIMKFCLVCITSNLASKSAALVKCPGNHAHGVRYQGQTGILPFFADVFKKHLLLFCTTATVQLPLRPLPTEEVTFQELLAASYGQHLVQGKDWVPDLKVWDTTDGTFGASATHWDAAKSGAEVLKHFD